MLPPPTSPWVPGITHRLRLLGLHPQGGPSLLPEFCLVTVRAQHLTKRAQDPTPGSIQQLRGPTPTREARCLTPCLSLEAAGVPHPTGGGVGGFAPS